MGKKAFDAIADGLRDAITHAKGDKARGRVHRVHVPDVDVGAMRGKLRLSQDEFASAFGVSLATVRNWEQGRRQPHGPARVLLAVIDKAPATVLEALGIAPKRRRAA